MPLSPDDPTLARVIAVSAQDLERLTSDRLRRLEAIYQRERDALLYQIERMGTADTFTARHLQVTLRAVEDALRRMREDLGVAMTGAFTDAASAAADQSIREVAELEAAFGSVATSRAIASLAGVVPHRAISLVAELADLETQELTVALGTQTRAVLQRGLLQGLNSRQLVPDLARQIGAAFDGKSWTLERTLRAGLCAATNQAHNESYTEVRDRLLPDLKRQGHEFLMTSAMQRRASEKAKYRRVNHPFSFYLEGAVAELDKPWRITSPQFPVMFWTRQGGEYVGMNYPAHLWERGRQVPHMAAWDGSRSAHAQFQLQVAADGRQAIALKAASKRMGA